MATTGPRREPQAVSNQQLQFAPERHRLAEIGHEGGSETFERELELTTLSIVEGELKEIDDALRRLDHGSYGICEECGKPIDEARLKAVPWARYCVVDQARIEQALSRR